jgi:hypothetical protein
MGREDARPRGKIPARCDGVYVAAWQMHHRFAHGIRRLIVTLTSVPVVCSGLQKREPAGTQVAGARDVSKSHAKLATALCEGQFRSSRSDCTRSSERPVGALSPSRWRGQRRRWWSFWEVAGGGNSELELPDRSIGHRQMDSDRGLERCRAVVAFRLSDVTGDSGTRTPTQPSRAWREKRHL